MFEIIPFSQKINNLQIFSLIKLETDLDSKTGSIFVINPEPHSYLTIIRLSTYVREYPKFSIHQELKLEIFPKQNNIRQLKKSLNLIDSTKNFIIDYCPEYYCFLNDYLEPISPIKIFFGESRYSLQVYGSNTKNPSWSCWEQDLHEKLISLSYSADLKINQALASFLKNFLIHPKIIDMTKTKF